MIAQNLIYDNEVLGIDLGDDGFTINDSDDTDTGANLKQNYPVLEEVDVQLTTVEVTGFLRSSASTEFVIEFYADQSPVNPTGFGQGEILLGVEEVETDEFGLAQFNYSLNVAVDANSKISAVAINLETGDTSEFGFDPTSLLPVTETIPAPTYILNSNTSLNLTNLDLSEDYEYSIILQNTESPDYVTEGGNTDFYVGEDGTLQACLNTQFCGDAYKFLATDFPLEVSGLEGLYEAQSYFVQYLAIDTDIAQTALHTSPVTQVQPAYWILTDATYDKSLNLTEFTIVSKSAGLTGYWYLLYQPNNCHNLCSLVFRKFLH
jgi:hypothetical protein